MSESKELKNADSLKKPSFFNKMKMQIEAQQIKSQEARKANLLLAEKKAKDLKKEEDLKAIDIDLPRNKDTDTRKRLYRRFRLEVLFIYIFAGICVFLTLTLNEKYKEKKPIHYVPGALVENISSPDKIPDQSIMNFTEVYLMRSLNFNHDNYAQTFDNVKHLLGPKILIQRQNQVNTDLKLVVKLKMSVQAQTVGEPIFKKIPGQDLYRIDQTVRIRKYYSGTFNKEERVVHSVMVEKGAPNKFNSFGLYVYDDSAIPEVDYRSNAEMNDNRTVSESELKKRSEAINNLRKKK